MKDRRRSQAVENIREYSERLCFDEEDIEVFKKNYYRKKTGENEQ